MEDLIRASALLISEDDVEEPFDEEADGIEKPDGGEDGGGDDLDMSIWEN